MTDFNADRNKNMLFVLVHFGLDAVDKSDKPLAKIQADMLLLYRIENFEDLTDDHLKHFADKNAVFNAWPYWREFVQSATARMQLPTLTLPTYRFGINLPEKSTISGAKKAILATTKETSKSKARKKTAKKRTVKK
jgi:preprotein translocase subunit SecB